VIYAVSESTEQSDSSKSSKVAEGDAVIPSRNFVDAAWEKFHQDMTMDDSGLIFMPTKGPATVTGMMTLFSYF
jgi:hypothetical protein